jgi:hypothetical protein
MVTVHERFRRDSRRARRGGLDPIDLVHAERQRLLAENMLPTFERRAPSTRRGGCWAADVDDVDLGIADERLVGSEDRGGSSILGVGLRRARACGSRLFVTSLRAAGGWRG